MIRADAKTVLTLSPGFLVTIQHTPTDLASTPPMPTVLPHHHCVELDGASVQLSYSHSAMAAVSGDQQLIVLVLGEIYADPPVRTPAQWWLRRYESEGIAIANDLNGSFAAVIIDSRRNTVQVVTDRIGSKSVFRSQQNETAFFSSSIHLQPCDPNDLDETGIACYLASGAFHSGRTPFHSVRLLERASVYECRGAAERRRCYWNYKFRNGFARRSRATLRSELGDLLVQAVRVRLNDQVPTYFSLSGGYDSRAILGILHDTLKRKDVRCISYMFEGGAKNSDEYIAGKLAAHCGYSHELIPSFDGSIRDVVERNAILGEGINHICHEIDAWMQIGCTLDKAGEAQLFLGDECLGLDQGFHFSNRSVLYRVCINGFSGLGWLTKYMEAPLFSKLSDLAELQMDALLKQCSGHRTCHDLADYLYLDQRIQRVLMPTRQHFPGRFFSIADPLLDNGILDFMQDVPSHLRNDKRLFRETAAHMFPDLFKIPVAECDSFQSYWPKHVEMQKEELQSWLATEASPLDHLLPQSVLSEVLADFCVREEPARARHWLSKQIPTRVRQLLPQPPPAVAVGQFLERALVLKAFFGTTQEFSRML